MQLFTMRGLLKKQLKDNFKFFNFFFFFITNTKNTNNKNRERLVNDFFFFVIPKKYGNNKQEQKCGITLIRNSACNVPMEFRMPMMSMKIWMLPSKHKKKNMY